MSSEQNVQVSDTTGDDQGTAVGSKKNVPLKSRTFQLY